MNDDAGFPNHDIPSFEAALQALHAGDDATVARAVFAFRAGDAAYVERVAAAVRILLERAHLEPRQLVAIGHALHGLERLPLRTPGLDIEISLSIQGESGAMTWELLFSDERFCTTSGGYEDSGAGSDAISGETFTVGPRYREYSGWDIDRESWPDSFIEICQQPLAILDCSKDEQMDWEHPSGAEFWEWVEGGE